MDTVARQEKLDRRKERATRKNKKVVKALVTPFPISGAIVGEDVSGDVLKYMFPCKGKVTKGVVMLDRKPTHPVEVDVKLFNTLESTSKGFTLDKRKILIAPNLEVGAGDCLSISLIKNPEYAVKELWISLLWTPSVRDVEAKSFLAEELEDEDDTQEVS